MRTLPPIKPVKALYALLFLSEDATPEQIRIAWRSIAARYHPDLNGDVTKEAFLKLKHAYETLSDPDLKAQYDATGDDPEGKPDVARLAGTVISQILQGILEKNEPELRIANILLDTLLADCHETRSQIRKLEHFIKRSKRTKDNIQNHWKRAEGIKNVTLSMLDIQIQVQEKMLSQINLRLEVNQCALEMLKDASYELPKPEPAPQGARYVSYTV